MIPYLKVRVYSKIPKSTVTYLHSMLLHFLVQLSYVNRVKIVGYEIFEKYLTRITNSLDSSFKATLSNYNPKFSKLAENQCEISY